MSSPPAVEAELERSQAIALYGYVWDLLDLGAERSAVDEESMINAAHASRWHWGRVGGAEQVIVGEWQISRAYAAVGRGQAALHHARLAESLASEGGVPDWVVASVAEGLARAHAAAGDLVAASEARDRAARLAAAIEDVEDRELIQSQIAGLPL